MHGTHEYVHEAIVSEVERPLQSIAPLSHAGTAKHYDHKPSLLMLLYDIIMLFYVCDIGQPQPTTVT